MGQLRVPPAGPGLPGQGIPSVVSLQISAPGPDFFYCSSSVLRFSLLLSPLAVFRSLLPGAFIVLVSEGWGFRLRWGFPRGCPAKPLEGTPRPKCCLLLFCCCLHVS